MPNQSPQMILSGSPYSQQATVPHGSIGQTSMRGMPPVGSTASKYGNPPYSPERTQTGYSYRPSSMWSQQGPAPPPYPSYTTQGQPQQQPHQQPQPQQPHTHPSPTAGSGQMQPGMQYPMPGYGHTQGMYSDQTPRQYLPPSQPNTPAVTQGWGGQPTQASQWWPGQP